MNNTDSRQIFEAVKSMTVEERMDYLKANRPELFASAPKVASFGSKAPKGGWTESDRVAK